MLDVVTPLTFDRARATRREGDEVVRLRRRLQAALTADQWRMCMALADADRATRLGEQDRFVDELCRHFPGPALPFRRVVDRIVEASAAVGVGPPPLLDDARRADRSAAAYDLLRQRLRAELTADQWRMCTALSDADRALSLRKQGRLVADLCQQFPGLAPAIRVVSSHIIDTPTWDDEGCCSGVWTDHRDTS